VKSSVGDPDPHGSASFWKVDEKKADFGLTSKSKAGSGSETASKSKFRSCGGSNWSHVVVLLFRMRDPVLFDPGSGSGMKKVRILDPE